jgi:anaerobic sulfite reductase subunit B
MISLTPTEAELVNYHNDGEDTRQFLFRLFNASAIAQPEPGQFFLLTVPGAGSAAFTFISQLDQQGQFKALIRRTGSLTNTLFGLAEGSTVGIQGPFGNGWPMDELINQRVLIIAGGCGLAPLSRLIDALVESNECKQLSLIYGAATEKKQMLNNQREQWRNSFPVFDVVEDSDYQGQQGTPLDILPEVLADLKTFPDRVLLCGPEIMMQRVAEQFINLELPASHIFLSIERRMHCGVGLCGHCYLHDQYVCKNGPTYRWDNFLEPTTELNIAKLQQSF